MLISFEYIIFQSYGTPFPYLLHQEAWFYVKPDVQRMFTVFNDHINILKMTSECFEWIWIVICEFTWYPPPSKIDFYRSPMTFQDSRISHPEGFWTLWTRWSSQISQKKLHSWNMTYKVSIPLIPSKSCNYVNIHVLKAVTSVLWGYKSIGNDFWVFYISLTCDVWVCPTTLSKIDVWLAWIYLRLITEVIYLFSRYIFSINNHLMCQSHVLKLPSCIQVDCLYLCNQCYPCLIPPLKDWF